VRTSVEEVSPGLHRWVARIHDCWGNVVAYAFSNLSPADAEELLMYDIASFDARLTAMTAAKNKAVEALKQAVDEVENLRARMKDGYNWTNEHSGYDRARIWLKDKARPLIAELEEVK